MTTTSSVLLALLFLAAIPIVGYYAVKLGTYANLRARDLYQQRHPKQGLKIHGEDQDQGTP